MILAKGLGPTHVVLVILVVRILSVFLVQTWYVPDEYWQTLEVAHKHAFGYGELTWEWQKGIRSYLIPGIITVLYTILKYTGLDYPEAVILLPRILQALLSAAGDYCFYKWTGNRKWALFLVLTTWFWFYTSGRTLLQTTETALVMIALSLYPFRSGQFRYYEKESSSWLWVAGVCAWVRPTSAPLWLTLLAAQIYTTSQPRLRLVTRTMLPIAVILSAVLIAIDSYFYGKLIVTPFEFFRYNILHDVASFYGTLPWYWYLTQGLPAVLGINLAPVAWGVATVLRRPREHRTGLLLLIAATLHVIVHSFIPHKEFRFVLPLLPLFLYPAQLVLVPWSRKARNWQIYVVTALVVVGNVVPALYVGLRHQRATLDVMPILRDSVGNKSSILFLMPCHSTPLYSHLHSNVSTRYLQCPPPAPGHTYEADAFYHNPQRWWKQEYSNKQPPSLVVMFDILKGRLENVLSGYKVIHELPHTQFPVGEVGEKVLVLQKAESARRPADEAQ